jgi:hypothetical protein
MTNAYRLISKLATLTWPQAIKPSPTFRTTGKPAGPHAFEGPSGFEWRGYGLG